MAKLPRQLPSENFLCYFVTLIHNYKEVVKMDEKEKLKDPKIFAPT